MSIIHTYLTTNELRQYRLSERDHSYFKQKLDENDWFNRLMSRPVNRILLDELRCLLDRQHIPRREIEHRNGRLFVKVVTPEYMEVLWE
ncbi:hypothetical protein LCGC14_0408800 [marine sediment metagenome]|uniref:Uncharacterized protein n=1 Tax=marine sediment metagenome TaxID=412755 RepID=A0A0F9W3J8_9ZZZZ